MQDMHHDTVCRQTRSEVGIGIRFYLHPRAIGSRQRRAINIEFDCSEISRPHISLIL